LQNAPALPPGTLDRKPAVEIELLRLTKIQYVHAFVARRIYYNIADDR
jgi:hypothetical protein